MSKKKYLPFHSMFFDDLFKKDAFMADLFKPGSTTPAVNIMEDDYSYHIEVATPGAQKENFSLKIENDYLVLSYKIKREDVVEEKNYHKKEFQYQSFIKSIEIPKNSDIENIKSKYDNGILTINIPKLTNPENTKEITID